MERAGRIEMLLDLLDKDPKDPFLNYALGLEYMNDLTTIILAEIQFRKVISLDENYLAVYYQLGKLYESQLNIIKAIEQYKTGLTKAREQKNNKAAAEFEEAVFMLED
jgi:tetratricopeptide (TPR) repeat protein